MDRPAAPVDVPAVGRSIDHRNARPKITEEPRRHLGCRSGSAIQNQLQGLQTLHFQGRPQKPGVRRETVGIGPDQRRRTRTGRWRCGGRRVVSHNKGLKRQFATPRQLPPPLREELQTVVAVDVVRGRDDDAGVEFRIPAEHGDGGSRQHSGGGHAGAGGRETAAQGLFHPGAALSSVPPHHHRPAPLEGEAPADSKNGRGVQRRLARHASNSVGPEESGHWPRAANA